MKYEALKPTENYPPFAEMSAALAKRHFDWFVGQASVRIDALRNVCAEDGLILPERPSLNALKALSEWLSGQITVVELDKPVRHRVERIVAITGIKPAEFSAQSMSFIVDASFYVAEYFLKLSPIVKWSLWTKRGSNFHRPVLVGFGRIPLVPTHLVSASAWGWSAVPPAATDDLLRGIEVWTRDLAREEK